MPTKNRILSAASALFVDKGYNSVSIRELAGKVGIKESSIYNHFASKQEIYEAILDDYEELLLEQIAKFDPGDDQVVFTADLEARITLAVDSSLKVAIYFHTAAAAVAYRRLLSMNPDQFAITSGKISHYFHELPLAMIDKVISTFGLKESSSGEELRVSTLMFYAAIGQLIAMKGLQDARCEIKAIARRFADSFTD